MSINQRHFNETIGAIVENVANRVVLNDLATGTDGAETSTVSVSGNQLNAQAVANQATNRIELTANDLAFGTTALGVDQETDSGSVTALVRNVEIGLNVEGDTQTAALSSTLSVDGNSSAARATGNTTSNSLVLNATNLTDNLGTAEFVSSQATVGDSVKGTLAMASSQSNTAAISALTQGVSISAALNAGGGSAMSSSMLNVNGNAVLSQAVGNSASNNVTVTAMADGSSYGMSNHQRNTGNVSASVTSTNLGVTSVGGMFGSSAVVSDNSIGSVAVGNSATNTVSVPSSRVGAPAI